MNHRENESSTFQNTLDNDQGKLKIDTYENESSRKVFFKASWKR